MRIQTDRPAKSGSGWIHKTGLGSPPAFTSSAPSPGVLTTDASLAPLERRSAVYRRLLSAASLSIGHRRALRERGFTDKEIAIRQYGSLPLPGRSALARAAHNGDPSVVCGVPGFWQAGGDSGPYWQLSGSPGVFIPCRDPEGKVRALRIRPTEHSHGGKYRWFSSKDRPGGVGSGAHCHVSKPATIEITDQTLWITEGELKADLASERLGVVVLSIPGVSTWPLALPDIVQLRPTGGRVVIALDADWRINDAVRAAAWSLGLACTAIGYDVEVATWDPIWKGLDDLLVAGQKPTVQPMDPAMATKWTLKLSAQELAVAPKRPKPAVTRLTWLRDELPALLGR